MAERIVINTGPLIVLFLIEALDIGGKERGFMRGKIKYTDEPMGKVKIVSDFLPPP